MYKKTKLSRDTLPLGFSLHHFMPSSFFALKFFFLYHFLFFPHGLAAAFSGSKFLHFYLIIPVIPPHHRYLSDVTPLSCRNPPSPLVVLPPPVHPPPSRSLSWFLFKISTARGSLALSFRVPHFSALVPPSHSPTVPTQPPVNPSLS
jgi:hypothetical protein